MKLEPDSNGFMIDAADLADLLGKPAEEVRTMMRDGRITSRVERGEREDKGRHRLTFFAPSHRVQLIVDDAGCVLQKSSVSIASPPRE